MTSVSPPGGPPSVPPVPSIKPIAKAVDRDVKPDNMSPEQLEADRWREHLEREERREVAARVAAEWLFDI